MGVTTKHSNGDPSNRSENHTNKNANRLDPTAAKVKKNNRDEEKEGNHGCDRVLRLSLALKLQRRKNLINGPEKGKIKGKSMRINVRPLALNPNPENDNKAK